MNPTDEARLEQSLFDGESESDEDIAQFEKDKMEPIDAEVVEPSSTKDETNAPARLSLTSIGGLKIRKPQDRLPNLNVMVYGDSGAGKTLLAGTSAFVRELSPVLFIDVEGGTHTLSHFQDNSDIDIIPDPEDKGRTLKWTDIQAIYNDLYTGRHPYRTVVIDSLTEMQKLAMNYVLGNEKKMDFDVEGNLPQFKDWHVNTEQMRRMVRAFRDLPINTIFTALSDDKVDPRTAQSENPRIIKTPSFTKKLAQEIPAFFDMVFYLYSKARGTNNVRYIQTDKDNSVVAKCRVNGIPMTIENPDMEVLYDMLIRNPPAPGETREAPTAVNANGMKRKTMARK